MGKLRFRNQPMFRINVGIKAILEWHSRKQFVFKFHTQTIYFGYSGLPDPGFYYGNLKVNE